MWSCNKSSLYEFIKLSRMLRCTTYQCIMDCRLWSLQRIQKTPGWGDKAVFLEHVNSVNTGNMLISNQSASLRTPLDIMDTPERLLNALSVHRPIAKWLGQSKRFLFSCRGPTHRGFSTNELYIFAI